MYKYDIIKILILQFVSFSYKNRKFCVIMKFFMSSQNNLCHFILEK